MEESFLAAIESDPENDDLKLIYADWLDEQADPRGQLIRLSVEMRRLAIEAEAAWLRRLKIQRERFRYLDLVQNANPEMPEIHVELLFANGNKMEFEGSTISIQPAELQHGLLRYLDFTIELPPSE